MKKLFTSFLKIISQIVDGISGKKKSVQPVRCQFCGEMGHDTDDCPNAAKHKLFNIDRE